MDDFYAKSICKSLETIAGATKKTWAVVRKSDGAYMGLVVAQTESEAISVACKKLGYTTDNLSVANNIIN